MSTSGGLTALIGLEHYLADICGAILCLLGCVEMSELTFCFSFVIYLLTMLCWCFNSDIVAVFMWITLCIRTVKGAIQIKFYYMRWTDWELYFSTCFIREKKVVLVCVCSNTTLINRSSCDVVIAIKSELHVTLKLLVVDLPAPSSLHCSSTLHLVCQPAIRHISSPPC